MENIEKNLPQEEESSEPTQIIHEGKLTKQKSKDEGVSGVEKTEPSIRVKKPISGLEKTELSSEPSFEQNRAEDSGKISNENFAEKMYTNKHKDLLEGIDEVFEGEITELGEEDLKEAGKYEAGEEPKELKENVAENILNFLKDKGVEKSSIIGEREFVFDKIFEKLKEKENEESLKAFQEADLLNKDPKIAEKNREELNKKLLEIRDKYNAEEIFKFLKLGIERGGSFDLEGMEKEEKEEENKEARV